MKCELVPINKVGKYCEGESGNTTLLIEFNNKKSLSIFNSGVGVAMDAKKFWDSRGKLALRKTSLKLQLVDGYIKSPIGLLEKIIVSSYGIEYENNFIIV